MLSARIHFVGAENWSGLDLTYLTTFLRARKSVRHLFFMAL